MAINSSAPRAVHLPQYFSPASLFLFCLISCGWTVAMLVFSDSFAGGQVNNGIFVFMPTLFLIIFCFILIFLCLLRESLFARRLNFSLRNVWFFISVFWFCCNVLFLLAFFCILPQHFVCFISVLYLALFLEDVTAFSSFVYFVLYWSLLGLAAERRRSEGCFSMSN